LAIVGAESPWPSARRRTVDAVQHVRALIASTPMVPSSLRALARAVKMSPFQLCRAFSAVCGETMTSYRLRLRLLTSLERLDAGERLVDIALAHGFTSHSHFGAAFRATFGTTPTAWRGRSMPAKSR
jgi:AraC-like DNA-binding protein